MRLEAKVGLFVILALASLFVLSIKVNKFANIGKEGYAIYASIENATGLEANGKVKVNGVNSGYIQEIRLKNGKPLLKLFIFKGIEISNDSTIIIKQESFLGGKFIEIIYGHSSEMINENEIINKHKIYASIGETSDTIKDAAEELKRLIARFNSIFDDTTSAEFKETVTRFKILAKSLTQTSNEFKTTGEIINSNLPKILSDMKSMIESIESTSDEFKITGKNVNAKLPEALDKFIKLEDDLSIMLKENREPLNTALKSVDEFFTTGEETFSKIDEFLSKATNTKLELDVKSNYMLSDKYSKTTFVIAYIPSLSNYYLLEITSGADYGERDVNGSVIEPGLHDSGKYFISAQMGKKYDNILLRAGIKENSGGIGIDYFSDFDVLKASLDLYDSNAVNDIRSDKPHASLEFRYRPIKHINFYAGADNFLSSETNNLYVGFGFNFVDDDLKYLLISAASASGGSK